MSAEDPSVDIGEVHSYTEVNHTVFADVRGAKPVTTGEGKRAFRPERIAVDYKWHSNRAVAGGQWSVRVELSGPWTDEQRQGSGFLLFPGSSPELPAWAREFAEENVPSRTGHGRAGLTNALDAGYTRRGETT